MRVQLVRFLRSTLLFFFRPNFRKVQCAAWVKQVSFCSAEELGIVIKVYGGKGV